MDNYRERNDIKGDIKKNKKSSDDKKGFKSNSKSTSNKSNSNSKNETRDNRKTRDRKAGTSYASDSAGMERYVGSTNDPSWYNKNTRLIQDVSKIPFGYQLGKAIPQFGTVEGTYNLNGSVVPGICVLNAHNVPGVATTSSDGVNLAATGLLQFIRKHLSTVGLYASADTMMYVLGIDDIYSDFANLARLFGLLNAYSATNLYFPKAIIKAIYKFSDAQFTQIIRGMNDYRSWFNNLIFKASTLYLPTDFTITDRHSWLYMNVFTDSSVVKSQVYAYRKADGFILDETSSEEGTMLKVHTPTATLQSLLTAFENKIDAYRNSDSMMKIAADMRRAFDGHQKWSLFYIDENWLVVPGYDKTVLSQIHNTGIVTNFDYWNNRDITQSVDDNIILYDPYTVVTDDPEDRTLRDLSVVMNDRIFNFYWDEVTPDDIIEGTRNQPVCRLDGSATDGKVHLDQCGAEIISRAEYFKLDADGNTLIPAVINNVIEYNPDSEDPGNIIPWSMQSAFDWAPITYGKDPQQTGAYSGFLPLSDLANYTVIPAETLSRIHANVICSMYSIPEFGGFNP